MGLRGAALAPGFADAAPCPDTLARLLMGNPESKKRASLLFRVVSFSVFSLSGYSVALAGGPTFLVVL